MESNEFENVVRGEPHQGELPDLAVRALSDVERIVSAEARLFETNIFRAAQRLLDRFYIQTIVIVMGAVGMVALLVSIALLLHRWLPWWQVMGVLGMVTLITAEVLRRSLIPSAAPLS